VVTLVSASHASIFDKLHLCAGPRAGSNYPFLTQKERDVETGLDYFIHRYYSSIQGRFTSPDMPFADQWEADPQSWNLYAYVGNNPTNATDPLGLWKKVDCDNGGQCWEAEEGDTWATLYTDAGFGGGFLPEEAALLKYYFQATPEIVPGVTVVDVSGFLAWRNSLGTERIHIAYNPKYMQYEFDFGVGGGLRNIIKAASKAGFFSRLARWLGFGKKAAPVKTNY
jgi:RHS repeat-associated protein